MLQFELHKRLGDFRLEVSIRTAEAGVLALFGPSGCGKSTLIQLLAGLLRPDRGRLQLGDAVLFDSERGIAVPPERRRLGYVFQDARLFPHYTVAGNLDYGARRAPVAPDAAARARVIALLGLEALLQRRPGQLSGGERQRVALGRALLSQPRLLLLDEPLASLDQARRAEVLPYLERVRDELKIPMVYVSHQFDEVLQLASSVALLERGRVLAHGPLTELSLRPELIGAVGSHGAGAVLEGEVRRCDSGTGLAEIGIGAGALRVDAAGLEAGQRVRLQLLARDLILALQPPAGLSVRNVLAGRIVALRPPDERTVLVEVDAGGARLLARVTAAAATELQLRAGLPVWVLVKAVTLRSHVFQRGVDG